MRIPIIVERTLLAAIAGLWLISTMNPGRAQELCRGDLDQDGVVTSADADALLPLLFVDLLTVDLETLLRADVNDDGALSGADIAAILALDGLPCPTPLPTATVTPTPTATRMVTPTPTYTRPATPTPTPVCEMRQITPGVTNGALTETDCLRTLSGRVRRTDVYTITAPVGTAITLEVAAVVPLMANIGVLDPAGQFESIEGPSPIQFTAVSTQPYQILVVPNPSSPVDVGGYELTVTSTPCPTPVALAFPISRAFSLDGTECPEPALPSVGAQREPADVYTFEISDVPKNVSITMQQLSVNDDIFPVMALLGPDGFELVSQDLNFDCTAPTGTLLCTQIRFMALQKGVYTILALGSGGTGRYSMTVATPTCAPKMLSNIPSDRPLNCPDSTSGCTGNFEGNTTHTPCAAPLPDPDSIDQTPELGSPAELYTFVGNAGDVISAKMTSTDDPRLYLLGPAPSNGLVATNSSSGVAQLAATLVVPGTYTIIAANNYALVPEDPALSYTLLVQKCPARGGLNPLLARRVSGTYSTLDCLGAEDIPYRTYAFNGTAGQFVTTTMVSSGVDSFVRVFAPNGSRVENDDDPFQTVTSDARANRILPIDGTYFVEVSAAPNGPPIDLTAQPPPSFDVRARSCASTVAASGAINGGWQDGDCDLDGGRRGDVFTFPAGSGPGVATISPPPDGCVLALLSDGTQTPLGGCSREQLDIPVVGNSVLGFIVAGAETSTRGAYTLGFSRCPATSVSFGEKRVGALNGANCSDPDGVRADWFLIQGLASLTRFNFGVSGQVSATFPLDGVLTDQVSGSSVFGSFNEDPAVMFSLGSSLAVVLRVTSATPSDRGTYEVAVDMATRRQ